MQQKVRLDAGSDRHQHLDNRLSRCDVITSAWLLHCERTLGFQFGYPVSPLSSFYPGSVISTEPLCFLLGANGSQEAPISILSDLNNIANLKKKAILLINPMWTWSRPWFKERVVAALNSVVKAVPHHKIAVFVNDPNDMKFLTDLDGLISKFVCGEFAATDPSVFMNSPSPSPSIDAAIISRVEAYKRVELAQKLESGIIISRGLTPDKANWIKRSLPGFEVANQADDGRIRELNVLEIGNLLSKCHCGLILSEVEGQNRATTEYLLAGVPVISTPSVGGRDRLLHPSNSIFVEPDPNAVLDAVEFIKRNPFDRLSIRRHAVQAIEAERRWLRQIVAKLARDHGMIGDQEIVLTIPHHGSSNSMHLTKYQEKF